MDVSEVEVSLYQGGSEQSMEARLAIMWPLRAEGEAGHFLTSSAEGFLVHLHC